MLINRLDFVNLSYDFRPNWTPLSPITDAFLMSELNITVRKAGKKGAVHMYKDGEKKEKGKKGRKKFISLLYI